MSPTFAAVVSPLSRERWTFCGIQHFPGLSIALLVNNEQHSSRALVEYDTAHPVRITEAQ